MNYIEVELEKRKSRVGGQSRFRMFTSQIAERAPVVGRKIVSGSKVVVRGVVSSVKSVDKAHNDLQDWRLSKLKKQGEISRAMVKRDKLKAKVKPRTGAIGFSNDSSNAWFPK